VNPVFRLAYLAAWGVAVACWWWLHTEARGRSRLLALFGDRHGGFVRRSFSWLTLIVEAREVEFVRMIGTVPCRFRLRYETVFPGPGRPWTVIEIELPDALMGPSPGCYLLSDLGAGRGLFLAGVNITELFRRFAGELPAGTVPALVWRGAVVALRFPFLMGNRQEIWVEHTFVFLESVARVVLAGGKGAIKGLAFRV
jgi:hypothetical protein